MLVSTVLKLFGDLTTRDQRTRFWNANRVHWTRFQHRATVDVEICPCRHENRVCNAQFRYPTITKHQRSNNEATQAANASSDGGEGWTRWGLEKILLEEKQPRRRFWLNPGGESFRREKSDLIRYLFWVLYLVLFMGFWG